MSDRSPSSDLLRGPTEDQRSERGRLTIFFGAAPGVGKTYCMLEAARAERAAGRDVVVGVVETHDQYDTRALLAGLEFLPSRLVGSALGTHEQLDLDAALARKPALLLVDELQHSNAEGSRHAKRHQDVQELLDAGIHVYTSLNVQHIESLSDLVSQWTQVPVADKVPDAVVDRADELRLIDLPVDELIERLKSGKVYLPEAARQALGHFFHKGTLIALRELSLRRTGERVAAQMQHYRQAHGIESGGALGERLLVCVSASPLSTRLVLGARRLVGALHADWLAVYVETPTSLRLTARARAQAAENMRLAAQLGAETVTLSGVDAAEETMRFARSRNVSKVIVGKPTHARAWDRLRPSFLEQIVRASAEIDVYVMSGEETSAVVRRLPIQRASAAPLSFIAAGSSALSATAISWTAFGPKQLADVVMIYLLGIVLVSLRFGYGPSLLAAVLSVLFFDFFFIPPLYTFAVRDLSHVVTFAVMFLVALVISGLTQRVRAQAAAAGEREQRTAALYALSRELAAAKQIDHIAQIAVRHLFDALGLVASLLVPGADRSRVVALQGGAHGSQANELEQRVAQWVWLHQRPAGLGTDSLPEARATYLPLVASRGKVAVLGVRHDDDRERPLTPETRQHLAAFANQIASAIERTDLAREAQWAQLQMETEQVRSSLLSSVSHDLRTPLAVVTGAASTLLEDTVSASTRRELTETILQEAQRLNRLVRNLLDMTRLQAGALRVKKEWQPLEEVVGSALNRMEESLFGRHVQIELSPDLPLVPLDAVLIEQVLVNLLENAVKYTPAGSAIEIGARAFRRAVEVWVADGGPGIPAGEELRIFEKFYRAQGAQGGGVGLGLAICRGIVKAHGGELAVVNRAGRGAEFRFQLPIDGLPPVLDTSEFAL